MKTPRQALAELKTRVKTGAESIADEVQMKTALRLRSDERILARWMEYSGTDDPELIDYSNPCVQIEYLACDPHLHNLAGRDGAAFIEKTGCDHETFMRYYDQSAESP